MAFWLLALLLAAVLPAHAAADEPALSLERLLSPPEPQVAVPLPARWSGEGRSSWHEAHREARAELEQLEARLRGLRDLLRERSGDWHATESSAGVPPDPELVRLRAEFKRDRQSLELAHRRLAELECDALIAGVSLDSLE